MLFILFAYRLQHTSKDTTTAETESGTGGDGTGDAGGDGTPESSKDRSKANKFRATWNVPNGIVYVRVMSYISNLVCDVFSVAHQP